MINATFMDIFGFIGFAVLLIMGLGISRVKKLKIRIGVCNNNHCNNRVTC